MISTVQSLRQTRAWGRTSFKCCRAPIIVSIVGLGHPADLFFHQSVKPSNATTNTIKLTVSSALRTDLAEPFELSVRGEPPRLCWRRLVEGSAPFPDSDAEGHPRRAPMGDGRGRRHSRSGRDGQSLLWYTQANVAREPMENQGKREGPKNNRGCLCQNRWCGCIRRCRCCCFGRVGEWVELMVMWLYRESESAAAGASREGSVITLAAAGE